MLKVIGAGLGRTGTSSLKLALEQLGFDKCYHMRELIQNPAHLSHWQDALYNGGANWDALFSGYQAAVDYPSASFYREQMAHYPDARVILSVRDPERWYESVRTTIYESSNPKAHPVRSVMRWIVPAVRRRYPHSAFIYDLIWSGQFQNRFDDKDFTITQFNRWNDDVKKTVPADRLLVFEAKQGWEPLCDFLGVPVPDTPYPHVNSREEFLSRSYSNPVARMIGL